MSELSCGSIATGIGYAWPKFTAYASDWDEAVRSIGFPFTSNSIHVSGWDIWKGCVIQSFVPRAYSDTIEKLLGKRGTIEDRHSLAAGDIVSKINGLRLRIGIIRASWDEAAAMWQVIARGVVGYAPLVGTPSSCPLTRGRHRFFVTGAFVSRIQIISRKNEHDCSSQYRRSPTSICG